MAVEHESSNVFLIWAFPGLFLEFIIFPWFIVYITIYNYFLAMVIGNRKEEGRVCMSSIHRSLEKARCPARIEPFSEPEKAKMVPGFEPSLLRQNATALPLAPPPQPYESSNVPSALFWLVKLECNFDRR